MAYHRGPMLPAVAVLLCLPVRPAQEPPALPRAEAFWVDASRFALDGDPSEWIGDRAPAVVLDRADQLVSLSGQDPLLHWYGEPDLSCRIWLGWDATDLWIGGRVSDEVVAHRADAWWRGDGIEVFLNARDRAPEWGPDDYQVMLAPNWPERPWGVYGRPGQADVGASDGGFGGVEVASREDPGGYWFEARLPWRNFRGVEPREGLSLPFNLALCDRDGRNAQDSYMTWTGEEQVAQHADRRGQLVLVGPVPAAAAAHRAQPVSLRALAPLLLAAVYALALLTRRVWRHPPARRYGIAVSAAVALAAVAALAWLRADEAAQRESRRVELALYASSFEDLIRSGALGNPEPEELVRSARELLAGRSVAPVRRAEYHHLSLPGTRLGPLERTPRRGIPFRRIQPIQGTAGREPGSPGSSALALAPGRSTTISFDGRREVDALHLVLRVRDPRWLSVGERPFPVLVAQPLIGEEPFGPEIVVRHRLDLVLDEEARIDRPGVEPAYFEPGGRLGRLHADAHLFELDRPLDVDGLRITNVCAEDGYAVELDAAAVRRSSAPGAPPAGMRAHAEGGWEWAGARPDIEAEVTALGAGAPAGDEAGLRVAHAARGPLLVRRIGVGDDPVLALEVHYANPGPARSGLEAVPLVVVAALTPFLVTMLAEALAAHRRIRLKLAVGFAASSAVPLLALTLLLDATLDEEHARDERDRVELLVQRAERELGAQLTELEDRARMLLALAELRSNEGGVAGARFPVDSDELASWWGEARAGEVRFLERVDPAGSVLHLGYGPGWRELPREPDPRTGLARPWGRLYAFGVARTPSGAGVPMTVIVGESPRVSADPSDLTLLGAGRDPVPTPADLVPGPHDALRRAVYGPRGELLAVLVARARERGTPVLADWSLTELLVAAGLTAVFTVLLFAGILTGRIVGPIERLDHALQAGSLEEVTPDVEDEVGHLSHAIQAFAGELAHRVDQLEALQQSQQEMSGRLDLERARRGVLGFFEERSGARASMLWSPEAVREPRAVSADGSERPVPPQARFAAMALAADRALHLVDEPGAGALGPADRELFGEAARLLALPLIAGGESRGAVVLAFPSAEEIGDLEFLRTVAAQAAVVLENARLYQSAVEDPVTGFLSEPGFLLRLTEEIQRAQSASGPAGVQVVQLRLRGLPRDDERAARCLREAALRLRRSVRGLAVFGRSQSSDLRVARPWSGARPPLETSARRIVRGVGSAAWPDGEPMGPIDVAWASWPEDGPSARFVLTALEQRLEREEQREARAEPQERPSLPPDFVVRSPLMIDLCDTLARLAEQEVSVLVAGETGTGKDRVAELVHRWSPRAAGPLVHIHCPSLPAELIEDELFGHEAGAFTGAETRRRGPFEYAAGGTVVLDEVGGLSRPGQVALLRILENREVLPLGATRSVPIDVRVVATTSLDLAREVEAGRFRRDLYFRLHVAQITVPPLRLRRADIPALVEAFLARFNASADRPVTGVDPAVLDALWAHGWPGNLRELENVLSRALVLADGGELRLQHLELEAEEEAPSRELNPRQLRVLDRLGAGAQITSAELAREAGVSQRTALRDLMGLVEAGWLDRVGARKGTRFRRRSRA